MPNNVYFPLFPGTVNRSQLWTPLYSCHAACLSSDLSESSLRYPLVTDHSSEYSIRYTVTQPQVGVRLEKMPTTLVRLRISLLSRSSMLLELTFPGIQ